MGEGPDAAARGDVDYANGALFGRGSRVTEVRKENSGNIH